MTISDPRVYCRVLVSGEFEPAELTSFLTVEPTETWRVGDRMAKGEGKWDFDGWSLTTPVDSDLDWPAKLNDLLGRVEPVSESLLRFTRERGLEIEIQCVAYTDDRLPISWFSQDLLKRIVALEASLDIDLYVLT